MDPNIEEEDVIEQLLKYFSDIPSSALRALIQGEDKATVTYNQKYKILVESVESKKVDKIDPAIEMEQYFGSIIYPIRKSIQNNIYWKSKHAPKLLGEAMKKAKELHETRLHDRGLWTGNQEKKRGATKGL